MLEIKFISSVPLTYITSYMRRTAHTISQQSLLKMEYFLNRHVRNLLDKLDKRAAVGTNFHLENVLRVYSQNANGDLSLGLQFRTQDIDLLAELTPLNDYITLVKLIKYMLS
jgi:hypothetical protein